MTNQQYKQIQVLRGKGMSGKDISAKLNLDRNQVEYIVRLNGAPRGVNHAAMDKFTGVTLGVCDA